jgi:hypothetical protein
VASKSGQEQAISAENVEEMLDVVDKNLERVKTLYEQYFLGIQKQAPAFLHTDIERKLRDLTQLQIRNTGMRYRLATLTQKFGAYNSYWKRTLRQIENGTYIRNLSKIGREAVRTGAEIPEEILAAMPKRMREQVLRDREQALAIAKRRRGDAGEEELLTLLPEGEMAPPEAEEVAAMIAEPSIIRKELKTRSGAHVIDDDDNFDLGAFFREVENGGDDGDGGDAGDDTPPDQPPVMAPHRAATQPGLVPPPPAPSPAPRPANPAVAAATMPSVPPRGATMPLPRFAPSQQSRPNPIAPGAAAARGETPVESMAGPFPRAQPGEPASRQTQPIPAIPTSRQTGPIPAIPTSRQTGPVPTIPTTRQTGPIPAIPTSRQTGPIPRPPTSAIPMPTGAIPTPTGAIPTPTGAIPTPTGAIPTMPTSRQTGAIPTMPSSRQTGPLPVPPGAGPRSPLPLRSPPPVAGAPTQPIPRPVPVTPSAGSKPAGAPPSAPQRPPPGMSDADVNALYAKYIQAKQLVGETPGPREREKLLKTINSQAPKIMEQYKAKAVDFSVVVKDNQVIIRAKPKT